jgi:hypothetical protein
MVPNYKRRRRGSPHAEFVFGFSKPGGLATFAAIRRTSSLLSSLAADRQRGSSSLSLTMKQGAVSSIDQGGGKRRLGICVNLYQGRRPDGAMIVGRRKSGRKVMEWFSQKTSIAGLQVSNWMIVLGAVIVALLIYTFMQDTQTVG